MSHSPRANPAQIKLLMDKTGCTRHNAVLALEMRDGILEFAEEYLKNRDIPRSMDESQRYPLWFQFLKQRSMH